MSKCFINVYIILHLPLHPYQKADFVIIYVV